MVLDTSKYLKCLGVPPPSPNPVLVLRIESKASHMLAKCYTENSSFFIY